jgi:Uncharacterized conserved protein (some members contain a von Willebrand factor type A (vWA) domain)
MKRLRWVYYPVMGISLIAGMYTGLRVFYIVFFTQLFAVTAVLALNLWTAYAFKYKQTLSTDVCEKGKDTKLRLEIINERPIPLSLIEAHVDVVSLREDINLIFSLAPFSGRNFEINIGAPYRGRYQIGMTTLRITDIFGLTVLPFDMRRLPYYRMAELVVLPRAQTAGAVPADIVDTKLFGDAYLKPADQGDSISGARLFHEGDALKRVHWKKSAQQGALFVKQYEYPEREHIVILVDTSPHGLTGEPALIYTDTVCECAASIALHSLTRGRAVHIRNSGGFGAPAVVDTLSRYDSLRRHLAILPFEKEDDLAAAVNQACRQAQKMQALFVITRGTPISPADSLAQTQAARFATTVVLVGGVKSSGRIHSIYVEEGSLAAEDLSGIR